MRSSSSLPDDDCFQHNAGVKLVYEKVMALRQILCVESDMEPAMVSAIPLSLAMPMSSWASRLAALQPVPKSASAQQAEPLPSSAPAQPNYVPEARKSDAEVLAEWRKANNADLSAEQALASGASLGPNETTDLRASNHPSKLHTEIKIDGKVVARIYNGGAVEMPNEYSFLGDELGLNSDTLVGPDLAENRAKRIKEALLKHGAVLDGDSALAGSATLKAPVLEMVKAITAQTQSEWQAEMIKQGSAQPGSYYERTA
jgi:hypothetical protein